MTRCKFQCTEVARKAVWNKPGEFVFAAKFAAVYNDSPENKAFFDATPCGNLEVSTYKDDRFTPGEFYFLDISLVVKEEVGA